MPLGYRRGPNHRSEIAGSNQRIEPSQNVDNSCSWCNIYSCDLDLLSLPAEMMAQKLVRVRVRWEFHRTSIAIGTSSVLSADSSASTPLLSWRATPTAVGVASLCSGESLLRTEEDRTKPSTDVFLSNKPDNWACCVVVSICLLSLGHCSGRKLACGNTI